MFPRVAALSDQRWMIDSCLVYNRTPSLGSLMMRRYGCGSVVGPIEAADRDPAR